MSVGLLDIRWNRKAADEAAFFVPAEPLAAVLLSGNER